MTAVAIAYVAVFAFMAGLFVATALPEDRRLPLLAFLTAILLIGASAFIYAKFEGL